MTSFTNRGIATFLWVVVPIQATKAAAGRLLMVTVDTESSELEKVVRDNMVEATPHIRILRQGTPPITYVTASSPCPPLRRY
jgi:hypothetical protein